MELGLNINLVAKSGGTALMFAAGGGHDEVVEYLLDMGADANAVVQATASYIEQVAKAILEGNEEMEPHKDGVTSLMLAAQGGHMTSVKLLVEKGGADVLLVDDEGLSALMYAVKGNFGAIAHYLVEHGANPNDIYIDDKSVPHNLLMDSIIVGNTNFSVLLAEKGANISFADEDGVTVITQASYLGQKNVVQALLKRGADPSVPNVEGINALVAATSEGHVDIIQMLLDSGRVDVNSKDKDGTNALMAAAVRGYLEAARLLIKRGVDVNAQNVDGHTALMFAYNGKRQVEELLVKFVDLMQKNALDAETSVTLGPMQDALKTHTDIVQLLLVHADASIKV